MHFNHPAQALKDAKMRSDFVLGVYRGALWIGVRFGNEWRPARLAGASDVKYFN